VYYAHLVRGRRAIKGTVRIQLERGLSNRSDDYLKTSKERALPVEAKEGGEKTIVKRIEDKRLYFLHVDYRLEGWEGMGKLIRRGGHDALAHSKSPS